MPTAQPAMPISAKTSHHVIAPATSSNAPPPRATRAAIQLLLEDQVRIGRVHTCDRLNLVEHESLKRFPVTRFHEGNDVWQAPTHVGRSNAVDPEQLLQDAQGFSRRRVHKDVGFHSPILPRRPPLSRRTPVRPPRPIGSPPATRLRAPGT